jgi:hypothetical protein
MISFAEGATFHELRLGVFDVVEIIASKLIALGGCTDGLLY